MRVLALYDGTSGLDNAYYLRVRSLLGVAAQQGVEYEEAFLFDMKYRRPAIWRLRNSSEVRKRVVEGKFDMVHAANAVAAAVAVGAVRGLDVPVVFDVHGDLVAESKLRWELSRSRRDFVDTLQIPYIDGIARRKSHHFLAVSTPLKEWLEHLGVPSERISIVRNGADIDDFQPTPLPKEGPTVIGYAGAMQVWQGLELLAQAASLTHEEPNLNYMIVGFAPEDDAWRTRFAEALGDKAELVPRLQRWEMKEALARTHALIIPRLPSQTVRVAMPTKFGEYLAMGRPVIVTDVDETARFVREHRCGWVSAPEPEALSAVLREVARTPHDELEAMAKRGRELAEKEWNWQLIGEKYTDVILSLVKRPVAR